ncbi:MAG TPA: C10 family peptidase [Bacteroidales bacterium]|nr:C10 family peptidase [Bacteroidales bacterium]HSA44514.1 C10 family peptidase [Bacteroidales bacterium]
MKRTCLLLTALFLTVWNFAGNVPAGVASKVAMRFFKEKSECFRRDCNPESLNIKSIHTHSTEGKDWFHVCSFLHGGYVVVSADDRLYPVLAYSFEDVFDVGLEVPASRDLMEQNMQMLRHMDLHQTLQDAGIAESWVHYRAEGFSAKPALPSWGSVGPLLTTRWDQGWPYNYFTPPAVSGGSGGNTWAGCMATAAGQVLYYFRWPPSGRGYTSYMPFSHPEFGQLSANFGDAVYRFDEMTDHLSKVNLAVAEFLYHIGIGLHMDYHENGSAGMVGLDNDSLWYFFKTNQYQWYERDSLTYEDWIAVMKDNLDRKLPLYYSGNPVSGAGHAFVCDGYQDSAFFHFNLGWGGTSNGYYYISNVQGFNYEQVMAAEVYPDSVNFTYPPYASGTDTLTHWEGSIADGSGPLNDYLNNTEAYWLISPQTAMDSITKITITMVKLDIAADGDILRFYDGDANTAPLLAELTGTLIPPNIVSSGNKVLVELITNGSGTAPGFYLNYTTTRPVWCTGTTSLTAPAATFDDGSGSFYYNNSSVCQWLIDPGINDTLTLYFNYFSTEAGKDVLKVYDAVSQDLLAEISGLYFTPPDPVEAPSGQMLLAFMTNHSMQANGWEVHYDVGTGINEPQQEVVWQVSPNPAADMAELRFTLSAKENVAIAVFDVYGRMLAALPQAELAAGAHVRRIDLASLPGGLYFLRMTVAGQESTKKLIKL